MAFDIEGAKKAGYSDAEIADHLGSEAKFDTQAARQAGYSDAEIIAHLSAPQKIDAGENDAGAWDSAKSAAVNAVGGAIRGAGSIGATLLSPIDIASDALAGKGLSLESNRQRRADMDSALQSLLGTDPNSGWYKAGKIGSEIAGTAGIGGLLANGARAAGAAPELVASLGSGGFSLGGRALPTLGEKAAGAIVRGIGGAVTGGAQAGLIDPSQAGTGAVIGAAMPGAVKAAGAIGRATGNAIGTVGANTLGSLTGTSAETVREAVRAGKQGAGEFLDNMRGKAGFDDVVAMAKRGISNLRSVRQQQYRSGMVDISNDKTVLDFAPIDSAMQKISSMGSYKGVPINSKSAGTVGELGDLVKQWRSLDPAEYHTPEGLDALKKAVSDIRDSTQFGTQARKAADELYNTVKSQITKQAPTYAKVMKDYSEASDLIDEVERSLSLGNKSTADSAIRKLQSLMRNNAQTSYGNRLDLASELESKGGVRLMPAIAGQAMNSWMPRGMVGAIEKAAMPAAAWFHPPALLAAPFTSPRLMGEMLYGAGRMAGGTGNAASASVGQLMSPATRQALIRSGLLAGITPLAVNQGLLQ